MKKLLLVGLLAVLCLSLVSCIPNSGRLEKAGKINVLVLNGTYREMGEQYGTLLKSELNEDYNGVVKGMKDIGSSLEDLQEYGNTLYETYPQKYKEIMQGLAETSGLGLEKAKLLNVQEMYVSAALSHWAQEQGMTRDQCSGIAAWGDYTEGPLVFGRNYDLGFFNHEYATLVVYNPTDGSVPTASFTFAGCIYVTTGMNSAGVFLELNNGSSSDPTDMTGTRAFAPIDLFAFLEQSTSLEQLPTYFESTLPDMAYIVQGADKDGALSFEWSTSRVAARQPDRDGLLAATNFFFDPSWNAPPPEDDFDSSVKRRDNLLNLAEQNKGKITPEVMMDIISTPLEEGGAFRPPNLTSYEVVAQPETLKMWLRVPEYQDWVEVDLEQYFAQ
jgi:hypothetical protein